MSCSTEILDLAKYSVGVEYFPLLWANLLVNSFYAFALWKIIIDVLSLFGICVLSRIWCPVSQLMNASYASLQMGATPACCPLYTFRFHIYLLL